MDETADLLERMRLHAERQPEPTAETLGKREVTAQLRALFHAIHRTGASASQLADVAAHLRTQWEILSASEAPHEPSEAIAVAGMEDFHDRSPITGHANPMAPPADLRADVEAGVVRGEVTFGPAFEGAPGIVHGGFVAALLDEALGMACIFSGGPGMTAELTTRYRHHTPIGTALEVEARLDSVDGRKIRTSGAVRHGDEILVEGSGLFIAVDVEKFARLAAARAERSGS